jgi:hypothetical protein
VLPILVQRVSRLSKSLAQSSRIGARGYLSVDAGARVGLSVSYSPTGDMIAAGCDNGKIYLVDNVTANVKRFLTVDSGHGPVRWREISFLFT